ncbi:peroxisomal and mitochondrial division factor 1-like [Diospyros lotus]|uniref:peroxisomal and mitochondrial division factor 1-like n=1 Tax=Diospyros lotus TaxID=55363 RepID=UPI00225B5740|nr:peroxisomal and mitochondrial division factor 1-like [Diospyros lotus]XP_052179072.1 peroxisomal and mitochondrial division factor 1-like [Diospyros lotus]XP_052179073.1 peroxisomal and mitochondrial division factor 1-like [Diospyros lotus]
MADAAAINGESMRGGDRAVEIAGSEDREEVFVDFDESDPKTSSLIQKIETLEQEKRELVHENDVVKGRIKKLKEETEKLESDKAELKKEVEQSEAEKKTLQSVAARAAELETDVSRMQHDLITSMSDADEANKEISELKILVEELKKSEAEKESKAMVLEKERNLLLERLHKDGEQMKAMTESKVRELEKKLEALEGRESVEKSERINIEREAKVKLNDKDKEIQQLKKSIEDLDSVLARNGLEMERMKKEREELEIEKNELEALLKKSERKGNEMEAKIARMHKEFEQREAIINELKNNTREMISRNKAVMDGDIVEGGERGLFSSKSQWPVLAASTGAIAAVAVLYYLRSARQN